MTATKQCPKESEWNACCRSRSNESALRLQYRCGTPIEQRPISSKVERTTDNRKTKERYLHWAPTKYAAIVQRLVRELGKFQMIVRFYLVAPNMRT